MRRLRVRSKCGRRVNVLRAAGKAPSRLASDGGVGYGDRAIRDERSVIIDALPVSQFKVDFDSLAWQSSVPGARAKVHREGARQLRLLEFTREFVEPDWCDKGHIGLVMSGTLEIDFHGRVVSYPEGSGIFIPSGAAGAHKARALTPVVRLVLVEDVA